MSIKHELLAGFSFYKPVVLPKPNYNFKKFNKRGVEGIIVSPGRYKINDHMYVFNDSNADTVMTCKVG